MRHDKYFQMIDWEDPCAARPIEERRAYNLCCFVCKHPSHNDPASAAAAADADPDNHNVDVSSSGHPYCVLPMWHERHQAELARPPEAEPAVVAPGSGGRARARAGR